MRSCHAAGIQSRFNPASDRRRFQFPPPEVNLVLEGVLAAAS